MDFPQAGFRISPLDVTPTDQYTSPLEMLSPLEMSLPSDKLGNTASVGVTIQSNVKSLADYIVEEKKDLAAKHVTVLSEKTLSANEWVIEYSGGRIYFTYFHLHSYRLSYFANGKIYRVVATANDVRWPAVGAALKACVDSFELIPTSTPASQAPVTLTPAKLDFPNYGFRISALDATPNLQPGYHSASLIMRLPVDRTLGEVDVLIEPYAKTMADYIAERKSREGSHADSNNSNSANTYTYTEGPWDYNRVILSNGKLYIAHSFLANIIKSPTYNADYKAKLKACVDSLELIPPAPTAASP